MKTSRFLLSLFFLQFLFVNVSTSQIIDPRKIVKRKAEDKVNQKVNEKVDEAVDQALNKVFEGFGKKTTNNSTEKTTTESTSPNQPNEAEEAVNGLFKSLSFDGTPKDSYSFGASYTVKITFTDTNEKTSQVFLTKYRFAGNGKAVCSQFVSASDAQMSEGMQGIKATVFDLEQQKMFMFMENNGQKTVLSLGVKNVPPLTEEQLNAQQNNVKFTKQNQTKTIGNYTCDAYLMEEDGEKFTMWISQSKVPVVANYYSAYNQMALSQKNQKYNYQTYQNHPEMLRLMKEGRVMLGMERKEQGGEFLMDILDIKENDPLIFDAAGYTNPMMTTKK